MNDQDDYRIRLIESKIRSDLLRNLTNDDMRALLTLIDLLRNLTNDGMRALLTLIDVFSLRFNSGIKDGEGASIWFDDRGKIQLEVDTIRVREKLTTKYDELQALKCSNGTLVISQSGKIKSIKGD